MEPTDVKQDLKGRANELSDRVRPQIEEAKHRLRALNDQAIAFIQEHPAACLLGAAAVGYIVARLARRQQS
jgi:ElaB/YqjD/DUF883 family membrane-anchored ribosome-binding protein